MQPISEVVHVNIFVESTQVARAGFGVPLIASYHTQWPERVHTYSSSTALETLTEDEGFATSSPTVLMMQALLAQNPKVREVKVGRRDTASEQAISLFPSPNVGITIYSGYILDPNGDDGPYQLDWTYTAGDARASLTEIADGIADAINAEREPNGVQATVVGDRVDLNYPPDSDPAVFVVSAPTGAGQYYTADRGDPGDVVADLNAIYNADPSFYGLVVDTSSKQGIIDAASWAESHRVIYSANTADADVLMDPAGLTTPDVATELHSRALKRTVLSYHRDGSAMLGAGWLGVMLPYEPGVATWAFKTVAGVPVSNELTSTDLAQIRAKGCNHYTNVGGVNVTRWGTAIGGTFVDNTICVDWATARIEEEVWALLASAPKLPFTDMSGDRIGATVMGVLLRGVNQGVFADSPAPTVKVPAVADIPPTERAQRLFGTVEFTARLAGAIHEITIVGRVTV